MRGYLKEVVMGFIKKVGSCVLIAVGGAVFTPGALCCALEQMMALSASDRNQLVGIEVFKVMAPAMVKLVPDSLVIKRDEPESYAKLRKEQLIQIILAGVGLYELALALKSGQLSENFKEQLSEFRKKCKEANAQLAEKQSLLNATIKQLKTASSDTRADLKEKQIAIMLEMSELMAHPVYTISKLLEDLNQLVLAKLVKTVEAIPPVKPYMMINGAPNPVPLSLFIHDRLKEMVAYTDAQRMLSAHIKLALEQLQKDHALCQKHGVTTQHELAACKNELTNNPPAYDDEPLPDDDVDRL